MHSVNSEFLPPIPCALHSAQGPRRDCKHCDFRAGCVAVQPQLSRRSFPVDINDPVSGTMFTLNVQRKQLPMTIKTASTLHTLQGVTAEPGLIFHWKFQRFFSEELRFGANYGQPCVNFSNFPINCSNFRNTCSIQNTHSVKSKLMTNSNGGEVLLRLYSRSIRDQ